MRLDPAITEAARHAQGHAMHNCTGCRRIAEASAALARSVAAVERELLDAGVAFSPAMLQMSRRLSNFDILLGEPGEGYNV